MSYISWGTARNGVRLGVRWDDPVSPSPGGGQTVGVSVHIDRAVNIADNVNTVVLSGAINQTLTNLNLSGSGQAQIWSGSVSGAVGVTLSLTATSSNIEYADGTISAAQSVWVPWAAPSAPTGGAASVSGTQANLTWGGSWANPAPVESFSVDRQQNGTWVGAGGGIPAASRAFSDTSLPLNALLYWRVYAWNSAAASAPLLIGPNYTKPSAPKIGTPTKLANGSIRVAYTNNGTYANAVEIQDSPDGTTWATITSTAVPSTGYYDQTSPNAAVTHRYRARAKTPDGTWSDWSATSSIVQLQAPPNKPTNVAPAVSAIGDSLVVTWTHNPVDSTPQRAYTLRHRVAGGSWTTVGQTLSAVSSHTITAPTYASPANVEVEVATWGAHANVGPWSDTHTVVRSSRPVVGTTLAANTVITGATLALGLTYSQPEGLPIGSWTATLRKAGNVVEVRQGGPADPLTGIVFATDLEDGSAYTMEASVTSSVGLSSIVLSRSFTVDYAEPAVPTATVTYQREAGTVTVAVVNPVGTPAVVANRVYGNGKFLGEIPPNGSLTWRVPPLAGATVRVRAMTDLPSSADTAEIPVPYGDGDPGVHLNGGPGYARHAAVWGGAPKISWAPAVETFTETYQGDRRPSVTFGEAESFVLSASALVWWDGPDSGRDYWRAILLAKTNVVYRDAVRTIFGVLRDMSVDEGTSTRFGSVSFQIVETLHAESDLYDYVPTLIEDPPGSGNYRIVSVAVDDSPEGLLP